MTMTQNIHLINISDELSRLSKEEKEKNKVRACLFNFILFNSDGERGTAYKKLVKSVVTKFPSRVIIINHDESAKEDYLNVEVSTQSVGEDNSSVFCELITLNVGGHLLERVPFLVLPQIVTDLPVYLLWNQDPTTENAVLPHLESFAKRIIFDSETCRDLQTYSLAILEFMNHFCSEISDKKWSSIRGWREILASAFDSEATFPILAEAHTIRIHYNKIPSPSCHYFEVEAAYLQAWLAAQLGWKFKSLLKDKETLRITYEKAQRNIEVILIPEESPKLPSGGINEIEIETNYNKGDYVFKRHPSSQQVFMQYSDKEHCELPHFSFLENLQAGQEIIDEIFYQKPSTHYKNMLQVLSQIPWRNVK